WQRRSETTVQRSDPPAIHRAPKPQHSKSTLRKQLSPRPKGIGAMKRKLATMTWILLVLSGGVLAQVVTTNLLTLSAPTNSDETPIAQGSQEGTSAAYFQGQLYSDPILTTGYNVSISNAGVATGNPADWSVWYANENDYQHPVMS